MSTIQRQDQESAAAFGLRTVVGVASVAASVCLYWFLQVGPILRSTGFSWHNFRQYFPFDQLSYLAIANNVRNGNLAAVEPFSETGSNHYPRLYYVVMGLLARLFQVDVATMWQVLGVSVQLLMVVILSVLCIKLTRCPAAGLLGFVPFVIGTFANATTGNWFHTLGSHGVLWGAYGVLFTLNGESAAICLAIVCLAGLLYLVNSNPSTLKRYVLVAITAAGIGTLANVQTYSFLTTVYLLVYVVAAYGLVTSRSKAALGLSIGLLVAVVLGGTSVSSSLGPLATLALGAAAALPGLWLLFRKMKGIVLTAALAMALTAAPTVLGTVAGIAAKDPFLTYRVVSSADLGVPWRPGLIAATIPLVVLAMILTAGVHSRRPLWIAYPAGVVVAWALVATNDRWGANEEPYRFWIDAFTIVVATALPILAQVIAHYVRLARSAPVAIGSKSEAGAFEAPARRVRSWVPVAAALVVAGLVLLAQADYRGFAAYATAKGTTSFANPQAKAIGSAVQSLNPLSTLDQNGEAKFLVFNDPCVNPFRLKEVGDIPVAFYNLGLAWPEQEPSISRLLSDRTSGVFSATVAREAGVQYLVTDTSCPASWSGRNIGTAVQKVEYQMGDAHNTVTLWRLPA